MKKMIRILSIICIAALITASFAGCGTQNANKNEPSPLSSASASSVPAASASATPETAKPVTLRFCWWGADSRHQATLAALDEYKKLNPHVTIEGEYGGYDGYLQKLMTQLAGGTAPDLMQTDPIWNGQLGAQKENFVDLGKEAAIDIKQFEDKVIQGFCTVDGVVLGLPMGINGFGLQINKSFMQKFGIPLDTEWTWEKIIEEGKKIHDMDNNYYLTMEDTTGVQVKFMTDYTRSKYGKYWATDDYKVNVTKEEMTEQLKTMKALFDSGAYLPLGEAELYTAKQEQCPKFINGQIGMVQEWSGTVGKYKAVLGDDNFAVGKAVVVADGVDKSTTYKPSMLLAVNSKSANVSEAVKFVNWMLNDKDAALILKDCRSIPGSASSRKALIEANVLDADIMQMVEDTLKNPAPPVPLVLNNSEIVEITKDIIQRVVFGKITPEKGAEELIARATEKLNELKASN